jgi:hypothetical protein
VTAYGFWGYSEGFGSLRDCITLIGCIHAP